MWFKVTFGPKWFVYFKPENGKKPTYKGGPFNSEFMADSFILDQAEDGDTVDD